MYDIKENDYIQDVIPFVSKIPNDFDKKWYDYINNSKDIQLSLICPTIKSHDFPFSMYNSIITKLNIEMIFVGPNMPTEELPYNWKWIKVASSIKPVQCWEIGMRHAKGETVSLCMDDQIFSPYAWDEAYDIYKKSNDYRTIVGLQWFEPKYNQVNIHGFETDVTKFNNYISLCVFNKIQLTSSDSIMSRDFFIELGGYDKNYIRQACEKDLFLRAITKGAKIKFTLYGRIHEYGHMHPLGNYGYLHVYQDMEIENKKWKIENGKLIQIMETEYFEFNDTIYTINQGATFDKWSN